MTAANATTAWYSPGPLALLLWPVGLVVVLLGAGGWRGRRPPVFTELMEANQR